MTAASAGVASVPGLDAYLGTLEVELERAIAADDGVVARAGAEAFAAGGKRLRPLLVFLAAPPDTEPPVTAGVAVELVHLATLVHDDLVDGAPMRRGRAAAWSTFGPRVARATGDRFAWVAARDGGYTVRLARDAAAAAIEAAGATPTTGLHLVSDARIVPTWGGALAAALAAGGRPCRSVLTCPSGEEHKRLSTLEQLAEGLLAAGADRGARASGTGRRVAAQAGSARNPE